HGVIVDLIGVYSPNSENRKTFAEQRDLTAFDSLEALIEASDVIHVCSPPVTHEAIAISALEQDKWVVVEKPFTGYFGDGGADFNGDTFPRQQALDGATESVRRILEAEAKSK